MLLKNMIFICVAQSSDPPSKPSSHIWNCAKFELRLDSDTDAGVSEKKTVLRSKNDVEATSFVHEWA